MLPSTILFLPENGLKTIRSAIILISVLSLMSFNPIPPNAYFQKTFSKVKVEVFNSLNKHEVEVDQTTKANESAMALPAPGGVDANLSLWIKADAGTSTTTDGANLDVWQDQSSSVNTVTSAVNFEPVYRANSINFNPAIDFENSDVMHAASQNLGAGVGATIDAFFVAAVDNPANFDGLALYGTIGTGNAGISWNHNGSTGKFQVSKNIGGPGDAYSNSSFQGGVPTVVSGGYTGATYRAALNGETYALGNQSVNINPNIFRIGEGVGNGELFDGRIAEAIFYSTNHSNNDRKKIESYLAIKYGITLDQSSVNSYLASDGATIWDATANATFKNDIAGIGQDLSSGLNQKQSLSASGNFLAIGLGTIEASNLANAATFAVDKSFLIWGHNGAALDFTNPLVNDHAYASKLWKVAETGTLGTVTLRVPSASINGSQPLLVRSTDATIDNTDEQIPLTLTGAYYYATIDFADGDYFTFAQAPPPAPGGVATNLNLWLKADFGAVDNGTVLTSWHDQAGNHNLSSVYNTPHLLANQINYHPAIDFDGNEAFHLNTLNLNPSATNPKDFYFVYSQDAAGSLIGNDDNFWDVIINTGYIAANDNAYTGHAATANVNYEPRLLNVELQHGVANGSKAFTNGATLPTFTHSNAEGGNPTGTEVGANGIGGGTADFYDGRIAEIIMYANGGLQANVDRHKIQSYLAIKYALTLDPAVQNYLASDGITQAWNDLTYWNGITAIGRDDKSGLYQKQSISRNSPVYMALGSFGADNASNTNSFNDDLSFFAYGHDGGTMSWSAAGGPDDTYDLVGRVFKVKETGTVSGIQLAVVGNESGWSAKVPAPIDEKIFFLVDNDTDFSSGATIIPATKNGTDWVADELIDFTDGQYFTIAKKFIFEFEINAAQVTCNGLIPNADGKLIINNANPATYKAGYSLGVTYLGPSYATAIDGSAFPFTILDGLANPTMDEFYTIRVFRGANEYQDYVTKLTPKVCSYADLSVAVNPTSQSGNQGEFVEYLVTLTNAGPHSSASVDIRVDIPPNLELLSAVGSKGQYDGKTQLWTIDEVPVGSETLTITYKVK